MKLIYTRENKLLVENARNLLQMEGIETVMKNEFSSGAAGDLAPQDTWPELWLVDEIQLDKAKALLERMEEQAEVMTGAAITVRKLTEPLLRSAGVVEARLN